MFIKGVMGYLGKNGSHLMGSREDFMEEGHLVRIYLPCETFLLLNGMLAMFILLNKFWFEI